MNSHTLNFKMLINIKKEMSRKVVKTPKPKVGEKTPLENGENLEKQKNFSTLDKIPYLQDLFLEHYSDTTKYICLLCTENTSDLRNLSGIKTPQEIAKIKSLLKEETNKKKLALLNKYWIRKHLETKTHYGFTKIEDRPRLQEVLSTFSSSTEKDSSYISVRTTTTADDTRPSTENDQSLLAIPPLSQDMEDKLYIETCSFLVHHHLSYESAPFLLEFMKYTSTHYSPELLERSHLSSTTTKRIIKDVICTSIRNNLLDELAEVPYSLLMDSSSDIFGGKYPAVFARFIDFNELIVSTRLLKVIELTTDQTGETLLQLLNPLTRQKNDLKKSCI